MIDWRWSTFSELAGGEMFAVLEARQAVFIVEQNCIYQDADAYDPVSFHLAGWHSSPAGPVLAAYARVIFAEKKFIEPTIGRVLVSRPFRGTGLGKRLVSETVARTSRAYPGSAIRVCAQCHLQAFYASFGFEPISEPYDEDNIPHRDMIRAAAHPTP